MHSGKYSRFNVLEILAGKTRQFKKIYSLKVSQRGSQPTSHKLHKMWKMPSRKLRCHHNSDL